MRDCQRSFRYSVRIVKGVAKFDKIFIMGLTIAGWSSLVARRAHNPKVVGSNPAPATINGTPLLGFFIFRLSLRNLELKFDGRALRLFFFV
jgi:hypothetical protein